MVNCFSVLGQGGFWVINKKLAKATSINSAIFLADLASKREYFIMNKDITLESGWFFNTQENIQIDTSLSPHEQRKASELLVIKGFLEVKKMGIPAKNYFKLNDDKLLKFLTTGDENFERLETKNFNDIYNNNKEIKLNKNILIPKLEEDKSFKIFSLQKETTSQITEQPKNPKEKIEETPCFATPLFRELCCNIISTWNTIGVDTQKVVHKSKYGIVKTLFIDESNTIEDYLIVIKNMKASGDFNKEGKKLTIMASLNENFFYKYKYWKPKAVPQMYKTLTL